LKLSDDFPIGFDTDVNAPAKAEYMRSLQRGENITSCVYVTVGTGVGVGVVNHGHMLHGLLHGEGGHISVPPYTGPVRYT
jgi:fructokinase